MIDELHNYLDSITDHHDVLHNHADVLEDHEVRLNQLEKVINTPVPEASEVAAAEAKVKDGEEAEKAAPATAVTTEKSESAE